ncbi:hypothetical protein M9Y10_033909 [Tritrichomonas musculus]|uniref:Uncharacterized protein n=1 Tax=Tritrichomonas musculus TaxID=1915356 RepID=A0ABR2KDF0_9EUKA
MFGSEGERLQELRQQQARQYAEQLRQQIAAKNSQKPKSPSLYSTTTSDSYTNPIQQPRIQRSNINSSNSSSGIHHSSSTNSTDRLPKVTPDPLPNLQPTSVAPLNLTITSFQPDPTPSLPRQQSYSLSSITDKSTFNERMRSLESIIDQQRLILIKSSETASRIFQTQFPTIENSLNEIQTSVNRFLNTELNQKIIPITDAFQSNRELLENESAKIKSNIEDMRESTTENSSSIQQFSSKFNDTIESIKHSSAEVKNDNNRLLDQTYLSLTKVSQIENRESGVTEGASRNVHDFEKIDNDISSSFSMLQQTTNEIMNTVSSQIAHEIKNESDSLERISRSLYSQVSELNQNVVDNINRIQALIIELTSNFKENAQSLTNSLGDSLNIIQDELDSSVNEIDNQVTSLVENSEEIFTHLQNETVSTIQTLRDTITQTRNMIEQAIEEETAVQNKNKKEIDLKFDKFDLVVKREMSVQLQRLNEVGSDTIKKGTAAFDAMVQDSKTHLIVMKQNTEKLDWTESKLNEIEKSFTSASMQVNESVKSLSSNYSELAQKFEKTKSSIEDGFQEIENTLEAQSRQKPVSYARKEELIDYEKKANEAYEKKISEIESQIAMALSNLAEISIRRSAETNRRPGSGVQKIKSLVNDGDIKPQNNNNNDNTNDGNIIEDNGNDDIDNNDNYNDDNYNNDVNDNNSNNSNNDNNGDNNNDNNGDNNDDNGDNNNDDNNDNNGDNNNNDDSDNDDDNSDSDNNDDNDSDSDNNDDNADKDEKNDGNNNDKD